MGCIERDGFYQPAFVNLSLAVDLKTQLEATANTNTNTAMTNVTNPTSLTITPLQTVDQFSYYSDGSQSPVVHSDPYVFDLEGVGHDVVLFAGLETQPNTPENFSDLHMQLYGWRDGQFQNLTAQWFPSGINRIEGTGDVVVGDFDGDGRLDIMTTAYADMTHVVNAYAFMNQGNHFERVNLGAYESWQHGAAAADINDDGYTDAYVVAYGSATTLFMGGPTGLEPTTLHNDHGGGSGVTLGDFMNDGTTTAIVSDTPGATSQAIDTMLFRFDFSAQGDSATLIPINTLPIPPLEVARPDLGSHDFRVKSVDFNHDGWLDAVLFSSRTGDDGGWHYESRMQFLQNLGNGEFKDVTDTVLIGHDGRAMLPYAPRIADFDRDGRIDFFVDGASYSDLVQSRVSTAFLLQSDQGQFVDTGRALLSPLTQPDGSLSTIAVGPDGEPYYIHRQSEFAHNAPTTVSIAKVDFLDRDHSETLAGTPQDDQIWGFGGDDTFIASNGNDLIIGGAGTNVVRIDASLDRFEIVATQVQDPMTQQWSPGYRVRDTADQLGEDLLVGIERLQFTDGVIALNTSGVAAQAYRLYKAAFDREAESAGLGFWVHTLEAGAALTDVAGGFIGSTEFEDRYGANPSDDAFIELLYNNVLDRAPDDAGYAFWQEAMSQGLTREQLLLEFSESTENQANVAGSIANGIEYLPFMS